MVDISPIVSLREATEPAAQSFDFVTILLVLLPFIAFLLLIRWGLQKKQRMKTVVELSYNLIALELLFFVIFPICAQPIDCGFWAIIPIVMFSALPAFVRHRKKREKQHEHRLNKAVDDGHLTKTGVIAGKLEAEIKKAKKEEAKKNKVKEPPKPEPLPEKEMKEAIKKPLKAPKKKIVEKPRMPEPKKAPDHKKIDKVLDKVVNKKD